MYTTPETIFLSEANKALPSLIDKITVKPIVELLEIPGYSVQRRFKTSFTNFQLQELEIEFEKSSFLQEPRRVEIAKRLGLSERQVKVWFANRRVKGRYKSKPRNAIGKSIKYKKLSEPYGQKTIISTPEVTGLMPAQPILPQYSPIPPNTSIHLIPLILPTPPMSPLFEAQQNIPHLSVPLPSFEQLKSPRADLGLQSITSPLPNTQTPEEQHFQYPEISVQPQRVHSEIPQGQEQCPEMLFQEVDIQQLPLQTSSIEHPTQRQQPHLSEIDELLKTVDHLINESHEKSSNTTFNNSMPSNILTKQGKSEASLNLSDLITDTIVAGVQRQTYATNEKESQEPDELLNILEEILFDEASTRLYGDQNKSLSMKHPERLLSIIEDLSSTNV